ADLLARQAERCFRDYLAAADPAEVDKPYYRRAGTKFLDEAGHLVGVPVERHKDLEPALWKKLEAPDKYEVHGRGAYFVDKLPSDFPNGLSFTDEDVIGYEVSLTGPPGAPAGFPVVRPVDPARAKVKVKVREGGDRRALPGRIDDPLETRKL